MTDRPAPTTTELAYAHADLDAEAFGEAFPSGFLVVDDADFHRPMAAAATARIDLRAMTVLRESGIDPDALCFALTRAETSPYSFVSIGRTANCDVCFPDDSVSKLHALVRTLGDGRLGVVDAGSANGTRVDDTAVPARGQGDPVALADGAVVQVGAVAAVYRSAASVFGALARIRDAQL